MDLKALGTRNKSASQLSVDSRNSSVDSAGSRVSRNTSKNRLTRLLPGSRRRTRDDEAATALGAERWIQQPINGGDLGLLDNGSNSLIILADEDSLPNNPTRPSLSPHPSHVGFLTSSSPLIPTHTVTRPQTSPGLPHAATFSTTAPTLSTPLSRGSPSPNGQLKEAFDPVRRNATISQVGTEPERPKTSSDRSGERGFGRLFSAKGRKSSSEAKNSPAPPLPFKLFTNALVEEPAEKTPSPKRAQNPTVITSPATPPNPLRAPSTFITPPTPVEAQFDTGANEGSPKIRVRRSSATDTEPTTPPLADTIGNRRARSTLVPSKLSQAISRPLTPAPEEVHSPGGTISAPQASGGFFSSVLSAAQNAATSLSNTVASAVPGQKSKTSPLSAEDGVEAGSGGEEVILSSKETSQSSVKERKPAIDTLGAGNLSLSHLGILDGDNLSPMSSKVNLVETANGVNVANDEAAARIEDNSVNRAVSKAYAVEKLNTDKQSSPETQRNGTSIQDDMSPVRQSIEPESSSIRRAGSVRSKLSDRRRRRTRGSSANTASGLAPPSVLSKSNTWTVAPARRNRDFHNLFKSVPEDDLLIEDYAAAYQKDILLQGRIYISEGHICFYSNIIGFVNTLVMSFDEVISVEKKSTAMIFQNGIVVQTLHARNSFASLMNRDTTYDLIVSIWRASHPNLRSSINGNLIDGPGTGDKTEKAASVADDESASEEIYDEDAEDDDDDDDNTSSSNAHDDASSTVAGGAGDGQNDAVARATLNRKVSAVVGSSLTANSKQSEAAEVAVAGGATISDFPGPATHGATECGDDVSHCEKQLFDATVPAPLGKVYSLTFGPMSAAFTRKLLEEQKCIDLQLDDDKRGIDGTRKEMSYQYVKPLSGPIGPKQTRCIMKCTVEQFDLEKAVTVLVTTQNPDVPSGNSFIVQTRYCLMWGPDNSTRVLMTWGVEWTGKSWIKGAIEKGAADGQLQYAKDLIAALRSAVTKSPKSGKSSKSKGGRRKKGSGSESINNMSPTLLSRSNTASQSSNSGLWGTIDSLLGTQGLIVVMLSVTVLVLLWRGTGRGSSRRYDFAGVPNRVKIAAYEEMWRGEEAELWRWLEERVGEKAWMGHQPASGSGKPAARIFDGLDLMGEQEVSEAIRVTKEKLVVLEDALRGRKTSKVQSTESDGQKTPPPVGDQVAL